LVGGGRRGPWGTAHLELSGVDDGREPRRPAVVLRPPVVHQLADDRRVLVGQTPPQRPGEHLLHHRPDRLHALARQRLAEVLRALHGGVVIIDLRVNSRTAGGHAELAVRVVVLEGEAERIHLRVAARAVRVVAVLLHALAERCWLLARLVLLERRYVW